MPRRPVAARARSNATLEQPASEHVDRGAHDVPDVHGVDPRIDQRRHRIRQTRRGLDAGSASSARSIADRIANGESFPNPITSVSDTMPTTLPVADTTGRWWNPPCTIWNRASAAKHVLITVEAGDEAISTTGVDASRPSARTLDPKIDVGHDPDAARRRSHDRCRRSGLRHGAGEIWPTESKDHTREPDLG